MDRALRLWYVTSGRGVCLRPRTGSKRGRLLQPRRVLLPELGHLGGDGGPAIGLPGVLPVVALVIVLGRIEPVERRHLRDNRVAEHLFRRERRDHLLRLGLLFRRLVEDRRTILRAGVMTLSTPRRRLME